MVGEAHPAAATPLKPWAGSIGYDGWQRQAESSELADGEWANHRQSFDKLRRVAALADATRRPTAFLEWSQYYD